MRCIIKKISDFSENDYAFFVSCIPELHKKISNMVFYEDRLRSASGYYLAKKMIAEESKYQINDLVISADRFKKPFMINCPLHFNISHSFEYVACAVDYYDIGIDIERIRRYSPYDLKYYCSEAESAYIQEPKEIHEREKRFCDVWTFKEAFQKLRGFEATDYKSISMQDYSNITAREYLDDYVFTICSDNMDFHRRKQHVFLFAE